MDKPLLRQALVKFFAGLVCVMLLLFLPAGTLRYPQGWLLIAILFLPMFIAGLVMLAKSPALLRERLKAKEPEAEQRFVVLGSGLLFAAVFIIAGLSFRWQLLMLPLSASRVAALVFLAAYALYGEVLRENAYLSRTVKVQEGQKVIDSGLYGVVRHPMYAATVLLFLTMPLVLGSVVSFAVMLLYLPLLVKRIRSEEQVLERGLPGYREYEKRVKYRLVPFLW